MRSLPNNSRKRVDRDQRPTVVQYAVAGYRLIKLVAAMPTSTVYAIDTTAAEMTILSIFGSLTRVHHLTVIVAHLNVQV
jgi:hypothetical protein